MRTIVLRQDLYIRLWQAKGEIETFIINTLCLIIRRNFTLNKSQMYICYKCIYVFPLENRISRSFLNIQKKSRYISVRPSNIKFILMKYVTNTKQQMQKRRQRKYLFLHIPTISLRSSEKKYSPTHRCPKQPKLREGKFKSWRWATKKKEQIF